MNEPTGIGELLKLLTDTWRLKGRAKGSLIIDDWEALVGPVVSEHCRPLYLKEGRLQLAVDSAAWMNELRFMLPPIERALKARGKPKVTKVILKQAPLPMEVLKAPEPKPKPELPPATAEDEAAAAQIAAGCSDPDIAETIRRVYLRTARLQRIGR